MPITHIIKQGECISSVAYTYGFFPDTIWLHPNNEKLKEKRQDPNILLEGDSVFIPDKETKEVAKSTGKKHCFRRKAVPETLRIRFLNTKSKPRVGIPYTLEIDGITTKGTTDSKGFLIQPIAPDAKKGKVILEEKGKQETYNISLGHLDPISEISGIQARLNSLGYFCGKENNILNIETIRAIRRFQRDQGLKAQSDEELKAASKPNDQTLAKLKECYLS